jgi:hypothetical protein
MTANRSRLRRFAARVKRLYRELEYAQRRVFELRTGVSYQRLARPTLPGLTIEELEAIYALPSADRVDWM